MCKLEENQEACIASRENMNFDQGQAIHKCSIIEISLLHSWEVSSIRKCIIYVLYDAGNKTCVRECIAYLKDFHWTWHIYYLDTRISILNISLFGMRVNEDVWCIKDFVNEVTLCTSTINVWSEPRIRKRKLINSPSSSTHHCICSVHTAFQ